MSAQSFPSLNPPRWPVRCTRLGLWLIGAGVLLAGSAGPLGRFGVVSYQLALPMLVAGVLLLLLGALLAIIGLFGVTSKRLRAPRRLAAVGVVVALVIGGYALSWVARGRSAPPIHEVSTDLIDPPPFVALMEVRERVAGVSPSEYVAQTSGPGGTIDVPARQREAYPDVQPVFLPLPALDAFARVEATARELGWEIVAAVPEEGRLEATDTSRFFGLKDDVVVRLRSEGGSTRIDVRSKSRVARGDLGGNAARVREFLARLQQL